MCAAGIVDESGTAATGVMANTSSEVSTILNEYKDTIALQQAVEEWFAIRACIVTPQRRMKPNSWPKARTPNTSQLAGWQA